MIWVGENLDAVGAPLVCVGRLCPHQNISKAVVVLIDLDAVIDVGWVVGIIADQVDENIIEAGIRGDLEGVDIQVWDIGHILLSEWSFKKIEIIGVAIGCAVLGGCSR